MGDAGAGPGAALTPRWGWLFLDVPRADGVEPLHWWAARTDTTPSPWRGDHDEFATLERVSGPAWLKFQRIEGPGGVHVDLDVDDPHAVAGIARDHGATLVQSVHPDVVVARSPGGFTFCLTTWDTTSGAPRDHAGPSMVDQLCLDIPAPLLDRELAFWGDLLGCDVAPSSSHPEFHWAMPDGVPFRFLFQRRDQSPPDATVTGHLDLACVDHHEVAARHVAAGATVTGRGSGWVVLEDPWGRVHCCTGRAPATGMPG